MYTSQTPVRQLFDALHDFDGGSAYRSVLAPWADTNPDEVAWLRDFGARTGDPIPPADDVELCRLYAWGRVNETLLLRFQTGRADGTDWPGPAVTPDEYVRIAESVGLTVAPVRAFGPFDHEVVAVEPAADSDQPVAVVGTVWPGLTLGSLMFSRGGVRVSGGSRFVRKEVAEGSTLYWAHRRKNRPCRDLSLGWGGNSQWRTRFRRDYRAGGAVHDNADGDRDLAGPEDAEDRDGLTRPQRIEVLVHRCPVVMPEGDYDLWPYDDRLSTPEPEGGRVIVLPAAGPAAPAPGLGLAVRRAVRPRSTTPGTPTGERPRTRPPGRRSAGHTRPAHPGRPARPAHPVRPPDRLPARPPAPRS